MRLPRPGRRLRLLLLGALLYTVLGGLAVPPLVQWGIKRFVTEELGLSATMGTIRFNPWGWRLTVDQLAIRDGRQLLVAAKRVQLNLEGLSLLRWAVVLKEFRLEQPQLNAVLDPDGTLNLLKLLPPHLEPDRQARWQIERLVIRDGRIEVTDQGRQPAYHSRIAPLSLALDNLSSQPRREGVYTLIARLGAGSSLRWQGDITVKPFSSRGAIHLEQVDLRQFEPYLQSFWRGRIAAGRASASLEYRLESGKGPLRLQLDQAGLALTGLRLLHPEGGEMLALNELRLSGGLLRFPQRRLAFAELRLGPGRLQLRRLATGDWDWPSLWAAHAPSPALADWAAPWTVSLAQLTGQGLTVALADLPQQAPLTLSPLSFRLAPVAVQGNAPMDLELEAGVPEGGRVSVNGRWQRQGPAGDFELTATALPLALLQPYLQERLAVQVQGGTANAQGTLTLAARPRWQWQGALTLAQLAISDPAEAVPLLTCPELVLHGMNVSLLPARFYVREVVATRPRGQLAIGADRRLTLSGLWRPPPASPPAVQPPLRIDRLRLRAGELQLTDHSLRPAVTASVQDLSGEMRRIERPALQPVRFQLQGQLDGGGPVRLSGTVSPRGPETDIEFRLAARQLPLARLSPYVQRWAGHRLTGGRLDLAAQYRWRSLRLQASHQLQWQQVALAPPGAKAVSGDLPLALALLTDRQGRGRLSLPLAARTADPDFRWNQALGRVATERLQRLIEAPFQTLLGKEAAARVLFAPGASGLAPSEQGRLDRLAAALRQRPQLQLEIRPGYDERLDAEALRRTQLTAALAGYGPAGDGSWPLPALERLYGERAGREAVATLRAQARVPPTAAQVAERDGLVFSERLYRERLEASLLAAEAVADTAVRQLAEARAQAIQSRLSQQGKLDPERVQLLPAVPQLGEGGQVSTELGVTLP